MSNEAYVKNYSFIRILSDSLFQMQFTQFAVKIGDLNQINRISFNVRPNRWPTCLSGLRTFNLFHYVG